MRARLVRVVRRLASGPAARLERLLHRIAYPTPPPSAGGPAWVITPEALPEPFALAPGRSGTDLLEAAAKRTWYHTFEFEGGYKIEGYDPTGMKVKLFGMPERLDGKTVLDIGTYDGYFAFDAARRGATDVLATDSWVWLWPDGDSYGNFRLIKEYTGLAVREQVITVEEMSAETLGGAFDIVLFFGVLYHAPDPLGYLRRVRSVTSGYALIETVVDLLDIDRPAAAFYPGAMLNGDPSNNFGPNLAAVHGLCADAGFSRVETISMWSPHLVENLAGRPIDLSKPPTSGRAVFRAWA